jgi:hypothetical protein
MNKADKFTIKFGLVLVASIACTVGSFKIGQRIAEDFMIKSTVEYGQREYDRGVRDGKRSWPYALYVDSNVCESQTPTVKICAVDGAPSDCFTFTRKNSVAKWSHDE